MGRGSFARPDEKPTAGTALAAGPVHQAGEAAEAVGAPPVGAGEAGGGGGDSVGPGTFSRGPAGPQSLSFLPSTLPKPLPTLLR